MVKKQGMTHRRRKILITASMLLVFIAMALFAGYLYNSPFEHKFRTKRFNRILERKEYLTGKCLLDLKERLEKGGSIDQESGSRIFKVINREGITILEYLDRKLAYWSDNSFEVPVVYSDTLFSKQFIFIHNGWFLTHRIRSGRETWIALLRVRSEYGFENKLVSNGFPEAFRLPPGTGLAPPGSTPYDISTSDGLKLFSLVFPAERKISFFTLFPLLLWTAAFLLLIYLAVLCAEALADRGRHLHSFLFILASLSLIYILITLKGPPGALRNTGLFTGYQFSLPVVIPSLGHLIVLSVLVCSLSLFFFRNIPVNVLPEGGRRISVARFVFLLAPGALFFAVYHYLFIKIVFDSNIVFEPYRLLEVSWYTVAGYTAIYLLAAAPVLYLVKVFRNVAAVTTVTSFAISLGVSLLIILPLMVFGISPFLPALFFSLFCITLFAAYRKKASGFNIAIFLSLIFSIYALYFVISLSDEKSVARKKVLAVTYSSEHDPEAEHLLINLWPAISADSTLAGMVSKDLTTQWEIDSITYYLHNRYFNGYWGNFSLSVVSCRDDSPLWISSEEKMVDNCFGFFRERIEKYGHNITGTGFYFLEGQGGRSYYIGQLFFDTGNGYRMGLFIELFSDVDSYQEGYSELLLDKKYQGYSRLRYYSFAKYINGSRVLRTGDFPYDKTDEAYIDREYDYRVFNREGYNHVLYRNGNVTVVISSRRVSFTDNLISFAYIFALTLMVAGIAGLTIGRPGLKSLFYLNFRQKLQISFIAVLLLSFISVGVIVAIFSVNQYKARHLENIKEKITSIYTEIETTLASEPELAPDWRGPANPSLNEYLISLSNVFNTDINLYDKNGYLMATSRPEVFYRNLTSRRLNMDAFNNLETLTKSEYIQRERIASLEYVSAYVPFYNSEGNLLAYLNLPYFRMQSVLAREISNVIVAVANFTILIILITMVLAVVISRSLTAPLSMLSAGLASVQLGRRSEHLVYDGRDEIAELVSRYNRMVDELQESARRLADSEREFAWREMAKQVAHEIKNPLTPMKLNVQQLFKAWKDNVPDFEKRLEKFTKNQIEYIETLSSIASAFSSFAKLPSPSPSEIDLTEQIKTTLELFRDTENITFTAGWPEKCRIMVYADREHLNGIFSNLIKNAIQSVPQDRHGEIKIGIEVKSDRAIVSVADNGTGIPDELKAKMFTPNFTTKSSGMGLGLSIVKRYVESAGGRVWFESEKDKGSVFFVELPVKFTVERVE